MQKFQKVQGLSITKETIVAYQGVPAAFGEQAAVEFFGENCNRIHVESFRDVMIALEEGRVQFGVLPIENSSAGNVETNYDLLSEYDMTIVGEQVIEVNQALMVLPGTSYADIKTVYSHPQALAQCSIRLEQEGWHQVSMLNTALSAKMVREKEDSSIAAIASKRAAELYQLEILEPVFNNVSNNATRFIVLSKNKEYVENANKVGVTFGLPHKSGALYQILGSIQEQGLNMTMISSRPIPGKQWEYYFFLEFLGNFEQEPVQNALQAMRENSINLRILGNYCSR